MAGEKKKTAGPSALVKNYLIAYNFIETLGWLYVLYLLITYYLTPSNVSLYDTVKCPLAIFQNAAILEVIHAALRMVSSNPVITGFQVASRVIVVCGVMMITEQAQTSIGLPLALLAWSVTEVIRYAYYTFGLVGEVPYFLSWLRYSLFVFLYPLGVTGELLCIYAAQDEISRTKLLTIELPNALNFTFHYQYFLWFVMSLYIPSFLLCQRLMTVTLKYGRRMSMSNFAIMSMTRLVVLVQMWGRSNNQNFMNEHNITTYNESVYPASANSSSLLFPRLYLHMFAQRIRVLGKTNKPKGQ